MLDYVTEVSTAGLLISFTMHMCSGLTLADQRALDCDMVLVHDDDLAKIIEICDDSVGEHF